MGSCATKGQVPEGDEDPLEFSGLHDTTTSSARHVDFADVDPESLTKYNDEVVNRRASNPLLNSASSRLSSLSPTESDLSSISSASEDDGGFAPQFTKSLRRRPSAIQGDEAHPSAFVFSDFDVVPQRDNGPRLTRKQTMKNDDFVFGDFEVSTELEMEEDIVRQHFQKVATQKHKKMTRTQEKAFLFGDFALTNHELRTQKHYLATASTKKRKKGIQSFSVRNLIGHANRVKSITTNSIGSQFVSCSALDSMATMVDTASGRELLYFAGHDSSISHVALSRNGKVVLTSSADCTAIAWDTVTAKRLSVLEHPKIVICSDFHYASKLVVTGCQDRVCRVWDFRRAKVLRSFTQHAGIIVCIATHPSQDMVASGSTDNTIRVWFMVTGETAHVLTSHSGIVLALHFSACGSRLLSNDESTIRLWNIQTGASMLTVNVHTVTKVLRGSLAATVKNMCWMTTTFAPGDETDDLYIVAAVSDRTVRVLQATTGAEVILVSCRAPVYTMSTAKTDVMLGDGFGNVYILTLDRWV